MLSDRVDSHVVRPTPKSCTLVSPLEILEDKIGRCKMIVFVSVFVPLNDFVASSKLRYPTRCSRAQSSLHAMGFTARRGGCGEGNQITQQIESHHLSVRPSVSLVRPFVPRNLLFISLYLLTDTAPTAVETAAALSSVSKPCFFPLCGARGMKFSDCNPRCARAECPSSIRPPAISIAVSQSATRPLMSARKKAHQSKARSLTRRWARGRAD